MKKKHKVASAKSHRPEIKAFTGLINFDQKTRLYLAGCVVLFAFLVLFKIHGSSIALWNNKTPGDKEIDASNGLLFGTPKVIRIDEWSRNTPYIFSQFQLGFPISNSSYGGGNNSLASNMPVKHITTLFRPTYWGFFLFDLERGFAWYWHLRTCMTLVGFFLLLMLLTRSNFLLSAGGSLWVLFSSGTQWWFSAMLPEIISYSSCMFVCAVYFLYSKNLKVVALNVFLFVLCAFSFITILYPPWLISAGYLFLILLLGYMFENPIKSIFQDKSVWLRGAIIAAGMVLLAGVFGYYYLEISEFVQIIQATVYPGSRKFEGGDISTSRLFADYLFFTLKENTTPAEWYNICEASGYILLFPILIMALCYIRYKGIQVPVIYWMLSVFILLLTAWSIVGLPAVFGKVLLLDKISGYRATSYIGVASIVLVVLFLNDRKRFQPVFSNAVQIFFLLITFIFFYTIMGKINAVLTENISSGKLIGLALFFTGMHFLFFTKWKWSQPVFLVALIPLLASNFLINPISSGLDPLFKHPVYTFIQTVKKSYSDGRWIAIGQNSPIVANLLKASGLNVFGGVTVSPDLKEMQVLDKKKKYQDVYNRYIDQFNILPAAKGAEPVFTLNFGDAISLALDPCDTNIKNLGVKYCFFLYGPKPEETECMKLLDKQFPYPIFAYKDSETVVPADSLPKP